MLRCIEGWKGEGVGERAMHVQARTNVVQRSMKQCHKVRVPKMHSWEEALAVHVCA